MSKKIVDCIPNGGAIAVSNSSRFSDMRKQDKQYTYTYILMRFRITIFAVKKRLVLHFFGGSGSSIGIATDYGLDGPGSNPGGDEIFRPSRTVLGPTQPPVQCVPGHSRG